MRMQMSIKDLDIVNSGLYLGYEYIVRKFRDYYCGYVAIPKGHRLYKKDYDKLDFIDCHGGLTFSDFFLDLPDWFIGFDCAHAYDDPEIQDAAFMAKECMAIIDQLVAMDGDA